VETTEYKERKEFIEELKRQWKLLWIERIDDEVRAEGIANKDFSLLFVDRGTVIMATRDYKPLDFKQILQEHKMVQVESLVSPNPTVGGWSKFAREAYGKKPGNMRERSFIKPVCLSGQPKKGGRGWLHTRL
jgi:hypothetical protein